MQFDFDVEKLKSKVVGRKEPTTKLKTPKVIKVEPEEYEEDVEEKELLNSLSSNMKKAKPKSVSELRVALEKFYDEEPLSPEENYWLYVWFSHMFMYVESWYDYLIVSTIEEAEQIK